MKTLKINKISLRIAFYGMAIFLLGFGNSCKEKGSKTNSDSMQQPELGYRSVSLMEKDNLKFKDLNKNNALDPYEDWRLSPETRASDWFFVTFGETNQIGFASTILLSS